MEDLVGHPQILTSKRGRVSKIGHVNFSQGQGVWPMDGENWNEESRPQSVWTKLVGQPLTRESATRTQLGAK